MTLRVCQDCTTAYAPDLRLCPHCGSERGVGGSEGGGDMPKIHKDREPTYATGGAASFPPVGQDGPAPFVRPESESSETVVGDVGPELVIPPGSLALPLKTYADMTVDELRAELESRGLAKSGNKRDLIERLEEHDQQEN